MKIISIIFIVLILLLFLLVLYPPFIPRSRYKGQVTDHFNGKEFYNPGYENIRFSFFRLIKWWLFSKREIWPSYINNLPEETVKAVSDNEIKVTFINHATVLIQTATINILTDPIWSERASPVSWYGPKRVRDPGIAFSKLPRVDIVLISHNHYDHLDIPSLIKLRDAFDPLFIVPLGNKQLLNFYEITHVMEMDWWQQYQNQNIQIISLPTKHWSARWINDRYKTLWGSYGIAINEKKIYFASDTSFSPHFKLIREKWGVPDLALLPIGSYLPQWIMSKSHLTPHEAVKAHLELQAKKSIAIHYGTFQLSDEGIDQPIMDLHEALAINLIKDQFIILPEGKSIYLK